MFWIFKSDPRKKLQRERAQILEKAMQAQRNGDIRTYSELTKQAESLLAQINDLEKAS